jgi:hypothetical protein
MGVLMDPDKRTLLWMGYVYVDFSNPRYPIIMLWLTDTDDYCWDCDHDTHACKGCGAPIPHGARACNDCLAL